MNSSRKTLRLLWLPIAVGCLGLTAFLLWINWSPNKPLQLRVPGTDSSPTSSNQPRENPALSGVLVKGSAVFSELPGDWSQFRGPNRDGIADVSSLATSWTGGRPKEFWSIEVGEGYAGPVIQDGRVFLMDYDREGQKDALRCFSLSSGEELWRFTYPVSIKRNHGMTRTVPAVKDGAVVAIGPKCQVICCDVTTGQLLWTRDLVQEFGATVPEWYTGQCPLIDGEHVILAPGGPDALLIAVQLSDGEIVWQSPNPNEWKMTHSSIMPMDIGTQRQYIYCANKGVVGVSATDGALLWDSTDWKISIATVPSPCIIDENRIFLTGGYNAGSVMLGLDSVEGGFTATTLFRLDAEIFGATQHTPILSNNYLYGIRADGEFVCLSLDGKVVWESGQSETFGLGAFLMADGLIFTMNDNGLLRLIKASPASYEKLAETQVLEGRESWGPMALADTRLLVRDFTRLACLDVGSQ